MLIPMDKPIAHFALFAGETEIYEGVGKLSNITDFSKYPPFIKTDGPQGVSLVIYGLYANQVEARRRSGIVSKWGGVITCKQTGERFRTIRQLALKFEISEFAASKAVEKGTRLGGRFTFTRDLF